MVKGPRSPGPGTLCTGRHPAPHLAPGWMAAEAKAGQDSRGPCGQQPHRGQPQAAFPGVWALVPALALCRLRTFGHRRAAATDGTQHAGHPILCPQDIPLGKEARLSPASSWVRDGDTNSAETAPAIQKGPGQEPRFRPRDTGLLVPMGKDPRCSGPKWKQPNSPGGPRTPAVGSGVQ